jgi:hypothetical protein
LENETLFIHLLLLPVCHKVGERAKRLFDDETDQAEVILNQNDPSNLKAIEI